MPSTRAALLWVCLLGDLGYCIFTFVKTAQLKDWNHFYFADSTVDILLLSVVRLLLYAWLIFPTSDKSQPPMKPPSQHLSLQDPTDVNIPLLFTKPAPNDGKRANVYLKKVSYAMWIASLLYNAAKWLTRLIRGPPPGSQIGNTWFWVRLSCLLSCVILHPIAAC
jgi:hypothetical protein